jgi:phenylalanyl-tRNA synthetase beta chain
MPSVSVDLGDLKSLIGKDVTMDALQDALLRLGAEIKDAGGNGNPTVDVLANRPDLFCIEGIARAVAPFLGDGDTAFPDYKAEKSDTVLVVDGSVGDVRPYVMGAVAGNVRMDDYLIKSLMDIQEKLHLTVGRKRAKVSIGVHDSARIVPPYTYRAVEPESLKFVPLGMSDELSMKEILERHEKGIEYASILQGKDRYPVIEDSSGQVLSFPPIINGTVTTVTPKTESLFIDATGTDSLAIGVALNVLCTSLADRGASIQTITVKYPDGSRLVAPDFSARERTILPQYVNGILGTKITGAEMADCLKRLRHGASFSDGSLTVKIPCYRSDILHDVDIAEDVAIGYGYWKIERNLPRSHTFGRFGELEKFCGKISNYVAGHGFIETFSPVLSNEDEQFAKMELAPSERAEIQNPLSAEKTCVRVSVLPSLLGVLAQNKHRELPQRVFEVGDVVSGGVNGKKLALAVMHSKAGFTECKSLVESVLRFVHEKYSLAPATHGSFTDGRCASVSLNGRVIGIFGELGLDVLKKWDLAHPVIAAELDVEALMVSG